VRPGVMMNAAQIGAEYAAECPFCHGAAEPAAGIGRGKCSKCRSEFSLKQKLPACPSCDSTAVAVHGNKHRCNQCSKVF
jgi:hypothetical protein